MEENNSLIQEQQEEEREAAAKISGGFTKFEEMFKAGVHYGYSKTKRNPKMASYIYGIKNNTEIFDLEKTEERLFAALEFLKEIAAEKKSVLFVGTKPGISDIIKKAAEDLNMPYVAGRWLGGTLTNFKAIRGRVNEYEKLKNDIETGNLQKYTKKERVKISKDFVKMEKNFKGISLLVALPAALIIVDPKEEDTAVREAKRLKIPTVAIMSSDCDPTGIEYPVPANDAAVKSVEYLIDRIVKEYKIEKPAEESLDKKKN